MDADDSKPVLVEAIVIERPSVLRSVEPDPLSTIPNGDRTTARVRVIRSRLNSQWRPVSGLAELYIDGHLVGVSAGARLRIFGTLKRPQLARNPGERNRRTDRRAERVLCQLHVGFPDCVSIVDNESSNSRYLIANVLHTIRGRCHAAIERHIGPSNAELAKALLLGARDGVSGETIDAFFLTGTMHLLAISGLHVSILAFSFFVAARRGLIPYRASLIMVMVFMLGYAALTGARPPVIRAVILIQIVCVSCLAKRRPAPINSLALAAIAVLVFNPSDLFRVGAQLSFVAVASLAWCGAVIAVTSPHDPLDRLIWRTRSWPRRVTDMIRESLRAMLLASLVVWFACLPIVCYKFHVVSPASIPLNVILSAPVAIALTFGVLTIMLANVFPTAADVTGSICDGSLATMDRAVHLVEPIPGSHFWTPGYGLVWTILFYFLAVSLGTQVVKIRKRWVVVLFLAWFATPMLTTRLIASASPPKLHTTFISVGHGTSVLIEFPNGRVLLYDCGHMGLSESGVEMISAVLWSRGIKTIDAVMISHADADHYNAAPGILERFNVGQVLVGPGMFDDESDSISQFQRRIAEARVPTRTVSAGQRLGFDKSVACDVIHPMPGAEYSSDNAASIVLRIEYQSRRILLPGDVERDGLNQLLYQKRIRCDVLMAPHHGSRNSEPVRFRDWSSPTRTVISAGHQTDEEASDALAAYGQFGEVFQTDRDGAVSVTVSAGEVSVECFLH